jgi:hypothetical protein
MKTIYSKFLVVLLAVFTVGCSDDDKLSHTNVSAVDALYAPNDNAFLDLTGDGTSSAVFEWQGAVAEDNGVVLYEVLFDKVGGDFSSPLYVVPADGNGFQKTLTINYSRLNRIATMAGIESAAVGKFIWTVRSSKGLNFVMSPVFRTLEVRRPSGFEPPSQLFITGTATEVGDEVNNALPFKMTDANTFEIYTKLKAGDYRLITRKDATPEVFYINGEGGLRQDGSSNYTGDEKVYRITIDFSNGTTTINEVSKIELWFPPLSSAMFEYSYAGAGKWEALNKRIEFKQESWGRDERYKFKVTLVNGSTTTTEYLGSVNRDNSRPDANTPASFWYLVPVESDNYDFTFKFMGALDMANVNALIDLSGDAPAYTHSFTAI